MNIKTESLLPFFFDEDALRVQPYPVGRVSFGNSGRAYYRWHDDELKLYSSLTTAINQSMPMPDQLLDWYIKLGKTEASRQMKAAQMYGTLLHITIGDYCLKQSFDFNYETVEEIVNKYLSENNYWQPECTQWSRTLQEDMAAWCKFEADVQLKVIAVELVLTSEQYGFGTAIDIVADAMIEEKGYYGEVYSTGINKGKPKESKSAIKKRILINMKSGRKGIYDSHRVQLEAERRIFEENFPDIHIDYIYNWAPNEWTTEVPTYKFVNQTGKTTDDELTGIMLLAKARFTDKLSDKKYINIHGEYMRGNDVISCIWVETIIEKLTRISTKPHLS